jgi:hypothetical protein
LRLQKDCLLQSQFFDGANLSRSDTPASTKAIGLIFETYCLRLARLSTMERFVHIYQFDGIRSNFGHSYFDEFSDF